MKAIVTWFLVLFVATTMSQAFEYEYFEQKIAEPCLNRLHTQHFSGGQFRIPGNSLESFISLVERIERNHSNWNIFSVAKTIIKRFGYDGMTLAKLSDRTVYQQDPHYQHRRTIIDKLIDFTSYQPFEENDLNEEEKCSMFFMVGHIVNNTIREGDESITYTYNHDQHVAGDVGDHREAQVAKNPREQGVVSLFNNEHQAVALGKVLLGIVAAETQREEILGNMFPQFSGSNKFAKDKRIDALVGVTIGDVVSHAVINKNPMKYGSGGRWNSTVCSRDYILRETSVGNTLAVLRGAIDGLLIGRALRDLKGGVGNLPLSKVLRMYYDPRGLIGDSPANIRTYCRRQDYTTVDGETMTSSIQGFYHAYYALKTGGASFATNGDSEASAGYSDIQSVMSLIDVNDGRCNTQKEDRCEGASNIFVVLDTDERDTNGYELQERVVSKLGTRLSVGLYQGTGTIGVYYNSRDGNTNLQPVVYNSTNPMMPACVASWRARDSSRPIPQSVDEESLMRSLNSTIQNFEQAVAEYSHAPAKVVVIFKYGELKMNEQNRIRTAAAIVRNGHRDTRVITIGTNPEVLQLLSTSAEDVITGITDSTVLADKLAQKICNVPQVFQYEQCWNHRNREEENKRYIGYVTPDYTQYWAMYPQYFLKSFSPELKFKIEGVNGDIRVCLSRSHPNPKEGSTVDREMKCQTTKSESPELVFHMKNPCHKYSVENCPPAYFSVTGVPNNNARARCTDADCMRTDQIKFSFYHKGISCNGCLQLLSSPFTLVFLLLAILIFKN